jgi:hypothetical protein
MAALIRKAGRRRRAGSSEAACESEATAKPLVRYCQLKIKFFMNAKYQTHSS